MNSAGSVLLRCRCVRRGAPVLFRFFYDKQYPVNYPTVGYDARVALPYTPWA